MKVCLAYYRFTGWTFCFIPAYSEELHGRTYTMWHVIIERNGKSYQTFTYAFTPSACICRRVKKHALYEQNPIS